MCSKCWKYFKYTVYQMVINSIRFCELKSIQHRVRSQLVYRLISQHFDWFVMLWMTFVWRVIKIVWHSYDFVQVQKRIIWIGKGILYCDRKLYKSLLVNIYWLSNIKGIFLESHLLYVSRVILIEFGWLKNLTMLLLAKID